MVQRKVGEKRAMEVHMVESALIDEVLGIFERACRDRDLDTATDLLYVLERMAKRGHSDTCMERAYQLILEVTRQDS